MTQDKDTNTLLSQLKKTLETWRQRAQGISTDPNVLHWQKVNIESFASVLEDLGLSSTNLRRARDNYPDLAQKVLQRVAFLSNELHNLESDIRLGPLPLEIAQASALKIEDQCKELKPDINILFGYHKTLVDSSKTLKENLNFHSFIPQARMQASGKTKSLFETGYSIYLTVAANQDMEHEENITNMFTYIDKVTKLQAAIEQTAIPAALPPIVAAFLKQQLKLCIEGCKQVRLFINFVSDYFQSEMDYIKSFQRNLDRLKAQPLTELLLEIQSQTDGASKCIQAFTHKKFLMDDIQKTSLLLSSVETFHRILTTDFIPYLESQVDKKNGLLNPHTIAAARSRKYFTGLKGLWRFVRMLLLSMNVNAFISTEELEEKIAKAIGSCSFFFKQEA
ncbi:MAG: hypothetical protein KKD73_14620, partial [Proteobacteria bacterium]|nr:hypothetical protein [Pseudomonadota bacterium]